MQSSSHRGRTGPARASQLEEPPPSWPCFSPASLLFALGTVDAHGLSLQEPPVRKLGWDGERGPPLSLRWGLRGQQALASDPLHLFFLLRLPV